MSMRMVLAGFAALALGACATAPTTQRPATGVAAVASTPRTPLGLNDAGVLFNYSAKLQALDIAAQMLRKLASEARVRRV